MDEINLENLTEEQKLYVQNLQKQVNGASMLEKEISLLKAGVAHDMQLIRLGEQGDNYEHLKYVCFDRMSPKYNLVQVLMKNIQAVEAPAKVGRPAKEKPEKETLPIAGELDEPVVETEKPKEKINVFEMVSKEIAYGVSRR